MSERFASWDDHLADSRGVHSIGPELPGIRQYPALFRPRRIGKFTAPNSIKYAACSVSNFNNPDGTITDREYARMEVVARTLRHFRRPRAMTIEEIEGCIDDHAQAARRSAEAGIEIPFPQRDLHMIR